MFKAHVVRSRKTTIPICDVTIKTTRRYMMLMRRAIYSWIDIMDGRPDSDLHVVFADTIDIIWRHLMRPWDELVTSIHERFALDRGEIVTAIMQQYMANGSMFVAVPYVAEPTIGQYASMCASIATALKPIQMFDGCNTRLDNTIMQLTAYLYARLYRIGYSRNHIRRPNVITMPLSETQDAGAAPRYCNDAIVRSTLKILIHHNIMGIYPGKFTEVSAAYLPFSADRERFARSPDEPLFVRRSHIAQVSESARAAHTTIGLRSYSVHEFMKASLGIATMSSDLHGGAYLTSEYPSTEIDANGHAWS
jgi:hypothetical protein